MDWIDGAEELPLSRQCELAEVPRATVYRCLTAKMPDDAGAEDLLLCRLIDEEYTHRPFYGSRHMVVFLRANGYIVNRKRVQRLMRSMGWQEWRQDRTRARRIPSTRSTPTCCGACQ